MYDTILITLESSPTDRVIIKHVKALAAEQAHVSVRNPTK